MISWEWVYFLIDSKADEGTEGLEHYEHVDSIIAYLLDIDRFYLGIKVHVTHQLHGLCDPYVCFKYSIFIIFIHLFCWGACSNNSTVELDN